MLRGIWVAVLLCLLPLPVAAQVMLLIPGHEGQQFQAFREAGAPIPLTSSGWVDGGQMLPSLRGVEFDRSPEASSRVFYTLLMPTERPVSMQAEWLNLYLDAATRRHPGEPVILVAHSIAGVVARYALVTRKRPEVESLITIASPHVDGSMIQFGDFFWQSPLGTYTPLLGSGGLQRLLELYAGISVNQPGNILRWLAHQSHPDIRYVSIIRLLDTVVDPMLQDMNRVANLRGRSEVLWSPAGHALEAGDGTLLAALFLESVRRD
ncbi:esterase/lipase family protein [Thioalkalivibrio nitratireducens]|uniref:esterase/lipase family protein n=1 Tax=Thioalkalivibrio nitratireducens TaxID=186931 RepID=UPI0005C1D9DD|nr:hypothetical protein [Thioalkalivibrio nitratireducens]